MNKILTLMLLCLLFSVSAHAAKDLDYTDFSMIPVLDQGRIKPLDSFARAQLKTYSGRESLQHFSAPAWLAETLFDPKAAATRPIFLINDPALKNLLQLQTKQRYFTLLELQPGLEKTAPQVESLLQQKNENLTQTQQALLQLHDNIASFAGLLSRLSFADETRPALWDNMAKAYEDQNAAAWIEATHTLRTELQNYAHAFALEIFYNRIKPFSWALGFYVLALIIAIGGLSFKTRLHRMAAHFSLGTAISIHIFALASRIIILQRPPVGTLYESVLFVSLICAALGFLITLKRRNDFAYIAGSAAAALLLGLAPLFLQNADSLELLVAVLNTNFWLTVHVLCITAAYGVCILTAILAHIALFRVQSSKMLQGLYRLSIAALLLTALGTILGGIWADQSWGRFWGWDPKENGALLIVLWLIWLQHGRISGRLNAAAFLAGLAFLNVIVALAWFGVNLLNTGLHSYGFISGIATGLIVFCSLEIFIIAALWINHIIRERKIYVA